MQVVTVMQDFFGAGRDTARPVPVRRSILNSTASGPGDENRLSRHARENPRQDRVKKSLEE